MAKNRLAIWGLSVLVLLALLLAGGGTTSANAPVQSIAQVGTPEPTSLEEGGEEPALPAVGVGGQAVCFGGEDGSKSEGLMAMMRIG